MPTNQDVPPPHGCVLSLERHTDGFRVTIDRRVPVGPVTVVGFARHSAGGPKLLVAEGWALPADGARPDPTRTWLRFAAPPEQLFERWSAAGPTYEVIIGAGHVAGGVCTTAQRLHMPCVWVR